MVGRILQQQFLDPPCILQRYAPFESVWAYFLLFPMGENCFLLSPIPDLLTGCGPEGLRVSWILIWVHLPHQAPLWPLNGLLLCRAGLSGGSWRRLKDHHCVERFPSRRLGKMHLERHLLILLGD